MTLIQNHKSTEGARGRTSRAWRWGIPALLAVILVIVVQIVLARASPILKGRVVETLRTRFEGDVQLDKLLVSVGRGLEVAGSDLRIFPPDNQRITGDNKPLIAVGHFDFRVPLLGLLFKPTHVGQVNVRGLSINVPPSDQRRKEARDRKSVV